ncbi:winged helix-turn-helix transcriptional regulator [Chitinophaga nivalis]|uniref:Helix-turn-helix transcriptional regulator n=1 Tax=Chitinophaga nivalis TaxID=2991709 RepID=A0ABT3IKP0_9BACT|nr:helix-turn-helix domain-containing protein [Chitinophaga nivalis]MCW3465792.1 helix-turn-helix transcriptional regulator [Chitinophaga nivalis]MCW3484517.1 helix-turn-helix transcriptional regulator [Chitinophaga nivalis]
MCDKNMQEQPECGMEVTMKVLGGKWMPCIIDGINRGIRRPGELHREIDMASPRVINMQLRELESYNIVYKIVYDELPLKVEYYLTELGESILPVIDAIEQWGNANRTYMLNVSKALQAAEKRSMMSAFSVS